jgi:UMF1 family MFS transporter
MLGNHAITQPVTRRGIISWMFFDWAAQPFFTVVLTFIFGPYFVSRLVSDPEAGQANLRNCYRTIIARIGFYR